MINASSISGFINSQQEALAIAFKTWQPPEVPEEKVYDETLCQMDGAVFNEEFVVYNVASTRKLSKIVEENEKLGWSLSKKTNKKEVYLLRFRGTWNDLARTLKTICDAGFVFYRNMHFYKNNPTRLLIMDIDGKDGCKQGIDFMAADQLIVAGYRPGVLVIPSSRCDYNPIWPNPNAIKKYHVFVYTDVYNCGSKEIADLSDRFITTINGDDLETAKERFEWDTALKCGWQYLFSKSNLSFEQIEADPNLNIRFHNEDTTIFEYRNFTELFSKDVVTLEKCDKYVPNAKNVTCDCKKPYCVPAVGETAEIEDEEKGKHRDFWKELRDFAGIKESGIYPLPHYAVGRLRRIVIGQRNTMATQIIWGICFNLYAVERYSKTKIGDAEKFALDWFNDIFNGSNVDDYEEFMNDFNPLVEYRRISEDTERMAMKYDYPDDVDDSKFRKTTRVGYDVSYDVKQCSSRDELKQIGMSRTTEWRKAKELGLSTKRTSKLDHYMNCTESELKELVKKGVITRVQKSRIIARRKTDSCI